MNEAAGQSSDRDATLISGDSMIGDIVGLGRLGPGKRLGRYIVLDRIGAGEHGIVYAAHDPEFDRKVAIKLLRPRIGEALVCEAERAAALTHPNLVKLHEIGNVHEVVFVVMDHIGGQRLREWIATGPKPWKLVVEILRKTGAGLAAAHRAALVHANFTPDNVLLDAELEPRVVDLGLAGAALASKQASVKLRLPRRPDESSSSSADALVALLTPADQRHGCWAYIAPELYAGELADARSDQFAYCVTLYEALYGERPFEARSIQAVLQAVREGRVKRPPARARVPRWLRRIVLRGLANDPAQRWPSMDALLDAIDSNLGRRSQRIVASVAFAIAALTASLAATRSANPLTPAPTMACTIQDADAAFGSAWTAERRARLEQRIAEVGRPWAKPLSASLLARIDAWAEAWQAEWIDACAATRVRADQPEAALDRRMHCLDRRRRQLDAYTGALLGADAADLADALSGVEALDQPDACRLASAPLPDDPEHRERVVEVAAGLDQARALELAGRHDQALAKLRSLSGPLRDASWGSLDAEHELLEARATIAASPRFDLEELTHTALPRALGDALAAGDDRLAAEIALELAALSEHPKHEPAAPWLDLARGLAERTGQPKLRAAAWLARARAEAHPSLVSDHARPLLVELCDEDSVQLAEADHILARAALTVGKYDEADAALERARDRWVRLGGGNHPRSLDLLETAAELALARGRLRAAESLFGELVARTEHVEVQPTPALARRLLGLAKAQIRQGEFMFARRSLARAVALYESPALADHPSRVGALAALALFEADRGELEVALVHAEAAVDAASEYGVSPEHWAAARHALGRVQLLQGNLDAADSNLRAALERVESAQVLYDLHRLAVARGERESAEALLVTAEHSLLWDYGGTPDPWQFVQLAVARWELCGRDDCDHDDIDQYAIAREDFAQLQNPDPTLAWDFKQVLAQLDS